MGVTGSVSVAQRLTRCVLTLLEPSIFVVRHLIHAMLASNVNADRALIEHLASLIAVRTKELPSQMATLFDI
jgi:hypothetical protein